MKIIQKICDNISDEIDYAEDYAKDALYYRENWPQIAEIYYKIANDKLGHINLLHSQVVAIIDDYRKKEGEPPEAMKTLYEIIHHKHIEHLAAVKGILSLYKQ